MNELINKFPGLGQILSTLGVVTWAIVIVVNVSLAIAVFKSASALERQRGSAPFGAPIIWALATLMGGSSPNGTSASSQPSPSMRVRLIQLNTTSLPSLTARIWHGLKGRKPFVWPCIISSK